MKREYATDLFTSALTYMSQNYDRKLQWVREIGSNSFCRMPSHEFLKQYCRVVYAAGFKATILDAKFPALGKAWCHFDLERICNMKSLDRPLAVINHQMKAKSYFRGCQQIRDEGYEAFRSRATLHGVTTLCELPYTGPKTQKHLARNIGLLDGPKDDIWLERVARGCEAKTVDEVVEFLAESFDETKGTVDLILWRSCVDGQWQRARGE